MIVVTDENVDELIELYADEWWFARDIEATFFGCSQKSIGYWRGLGSLRSRVIPKRQRQPWVQWNVGDVIVARHRTRKEVVFLRRMARGGSFEYRCTGCLTWKDEDLFFNDGRHTGYGKFTRCKACRHAKTIELRKLEHIKQGERDRVKRKHAELREMRKVAAKWRQPKFVDASFVLDLLDARYGHMSDEHVSESAGMHIDYVRSLRRTKVTRAVKAEDLFVGLDMMHEAAMLNDLLEQGRPMWHPDHPYCVRCQRNNKSYAARGMCTSCYRNRNNPDYVPAVWSWAKYHHACIECGRSNVKHAAKGLCHGCYYRPRRRVGLGHGNHGQVEP